MSRFWIPRYREARAHAAIAAIIMWTAAVVTTFSASGERTLLGRLKGSDFIQLYTLGHLAREGRYPGLAETDTFHKRQVELVPASDPETYLPVYPPQAALLFVPLTLLPYQAALSLWTAILLAGYAWGVWYTWRTARDALPDGLFVGIAAAAFPPFFSLVLFGQTTIVPFLAFVFAWAALRGNRPLVAGAALGLLSLKPQFAIVITCVMLFTGEWRMIAGAASSLLVQLAAVVQLMGTDALTTYYQTLQSLPQVEFLLEPNPWRMHSMRALTRLLPDPADRTVWLVLSAGAVVVTRRVWITPRPLSVRFGLLVVATVLVNPHLFVYDATVLALPLLWLGAWVERERLPIRTEYWACVYALFLLLLFPTAVLISVQGSVPLLAWMFWRLSSAARA